MGTPSPNPSLRLQPPFPVSAFRWGRGRSHGVSRSSRSGGGPQAISGGGLDREGGSARRDWAPGSRDGEGRTAGGLSLTGLGVLCCPLQEGRG